MRKWVPVLVVFVAIAAMCCSQWGRVSVKSTMSAGVEKIPGKIGFFPLLSAPIETRRVQTRYALERAASMRVRKRTDNIVIVPPTEMSLSITPESGIMTGMLSTELSELGFSLKELPVEILPGRNDPGRIGGKRDSFTISLALLSELEERYGLEALVVGNAFFVSRQYQDMLPEKRVVYIHVKVIEISTLDILGQVTLPYESSGAGLEAVAEAVAISLAGMAGFDVE